MQRQHKLFVKPGLLKAVLFHFHILKKDQSPGPYYLSCLHSNNLYDIQPENKR